MLPKSLSPLSFVQGFRQRIRIPNKLNYLLLLLKFLIKKIFITYHFYVDLPSTLKMCYRQKALLMHRRILTLAPAPDPGELPPSVANSTPWVPTEGFHFSPQRTAPTTVAVCPNTSHLFLKHLCVQA